MHPSAQTCCATYCLWARAWLNEEAASWTTAEAAGRRLTSEDQLPADEVARVLDPADANRGIGYALDTPRSARLAAEPSECYEARVKLVIAYCHDTNTTAAVRLGAMSRCVTERECFPSAGYLACADGPFSTH